ncbi:histone family protein nucleoid-structuring protein H-NS [Caballeronia peredens]|nr:histone family protein nucleoid-structuring protein H-NS [Caballeronia peredens]
MATLKQIQARLKKLQAQAESLIARRAQAVLDDIRAMMERHGLTTDDIDKHGRTSKRAASPHVTLPAPAGRREAVKKMAKKGKLPAKYRNPKTGETWSGWARPPAWIANVKDRSKFLIDADETESATKPKAAVKKTAAKKIAAKKVATKKAATKKAAAKKTLPSQARAPVARKSKSAETSTKRSAPRKKTATAAAPQDVAETQPASTAPAPADSSTTA